MSEEFLKLKNRVIKTEKEIISLNNVYSQLEEENGDRCKEIKGLEDWRAARDRQLSALEQELYGKNPEDDSGLVDRIEALEKKLEALNWDVEHRTCNALLSYIERQKQELNELKEDNHIEHLNIANCISENIADIINLESVLTKSLDLAESIFTGRIDSKEDFNEYCRNINDLKKKLSGEKTAVYEGSGTLGVDRKTKLTNSKPESDCINIRENVKFLTNDTYIVISREDFDKLMDLAHDCDFQLYCKLKKEVEKS